MKYAISVIPASLRMPMGLRRRVAFLERSQWWSRDRMESYQLEQTNSILRWAEQHIPYFRDMSPGTLPLRSMADLHQWPITNRRMMGDAPLLFQPRGWPQWRLRHGTTSGRSGTPLRVQWEWPSSVLWEAAHIRRALCWGSIDSRTPVAVLRGNKTHGPFGPETRAVQWIPHRNRLVLSLFQLNEDSVAYYILQMRKRGVQALQAYPSAALRFVRLMASRGCEPPVLKAVFTSSEQLGLSERREIEELLGARVYDLYGHAERAVAAAQCGTGSGYHVFEEYGFMEVLGTHDTHCNPGESGEVIATGFLNRAMPFIRYRTGDFATVSPDSCPCGRTLVLLSRVEGRPPEYLIDLRGDPVSIRMGLGQAALKNITAMRFYQSRPGHAVLHVVPLSHTPREETRTRLHHEFSHRFGGNLKFRIQFVDAIEPGPDGRQTLVQRSVNIRNGLQ